MCVCWMPQNSAQTPRYVPAFSAVNRSTLCWPGIVSTLPASSGTQKLCTTLAEPGARRLAPATSERGHEDEARDDDVDAGREAEHQPPEAGDVAGFGAVRVERRRVVAARSEREHGGEHPREGGDVTHAAHPRFQ